MHMNAVNASQNAVTIVDRHRLTIRVGKVAKPGPLRTVGSKSSYFTIIILEINGIISGKRDLDEINSMFIT